MATASPLLKVAVRDLVDFVWRRGDLGSRDGLRASAVEGARGHRLLQASRPPGYRAEVPLELTYRHGDLALLIGGRADGIFTDVDPPVLEEIKTTVQPPLLIGPDDHPLHLAQAKLYAAILARHQCLAAVDVRLTYLQLDTAQVRSFDRRFAADELDGFLVETAERYAVWLAAVLAWRRDRDRQARVAPFPHRAHRAGQAELATAARRAVGEAGRLFCQAPTGIGKTAAVLHGAVRALGSGAAAQLFYLTAKTTGRRAAEQAIAELAAAGAPLKALTLVARARLCPHPGSACAPGDCPVAAGHFDRVRPALAAGFARATLDRAALSEIAADHRVCPFQLALALTPWVDVVIGDYNYAFDPRVSPKVMLAPTFGRRAFLVDEAHNLVDRAREMFSAELGTGEVRAALRTLSGRSALRSAVERLRGALQEACAAALGEAGRAAITGLPDQLLDAVERVIDRAESALRQPGGESIDAAVRELYFRAAAFARLAAQRSDRHAVFAARAGRDHALKIYCVDPAPDLARALDGRAAVFFSGTLAPIEYFRRVLGGARDDARLDLASPFPAEHRCLALADHVSTRLRDRHGSLPEVAALIETVLRARRGNYLVYLPSYAYLRAVVEQVATRAPDLSLLVQQPEMGDLAREEFLARFTADCAAPALGFAVLGGAFGEGIDLVGERLTGVVIVGVGLPAVCPERELIRAHFDTDAERGFEYAYLYPGLGRVLQAAGRLIRSETDRGAIVLIGQRFAEPAYRRLLPRDWGRPAPARSPAELEAVLARFWGAPAAPAG